MEALRQENSQLRSKIEIDAMLTGKEKEVQVESKTPMYVPTEEESEYNPTPNTFTTTHHTSTLPTHPTLAPPNYHLAHFPTAAKYPIAANSYKRRHSFIDDIIKTPS